MMLGTHCEEFFWSAHFMMEKTSMSQINKIANVLERNPQYPGLTTAMIAKKTSVPKANVAKRVADLRSEGLRIYTNWRKVNGKRKAYYRMAV
jgi:Mn-dependent DtxR family transcriptional regulator